MLVKVYIAIAMYIESLSAAKFRRDDREDYHGLRAVFSLFIS